MAKELTVKFKNRADTAINWTTANPILGLGELGLETNTNKIKFGDGVSTWNSLPYYSDIAISNTTITQVLAAETGYIAQLTVDELLTDTKVQNYLNNDTSPIEYQHMFGKYYRMIYASTDGTQTEQATSRGQALYWKDENKEAVTLEATDYPVMIYVYDEPVVFQISFSIGSAVEMILGQGDGVLPNSAKFYLKKIATGVELTYYRSNTAEPRKLILSDNDIHIEGNTGDTGLRNIGVGTVLPASGENNELFILKGGA